QTLTLPETLVITADDVFVLVDLSVQFAVVDARKAIYEIADYRQMLEVAAVIVLRKDLGALRLEDALGSRAAVGAAVAAGSNDKAGQFGLTVDRVEIGAIAPRPEDMRDAPA